MGGKRKWSFSVFYDYLLSYVGVAVLFCALLGVFLFNFFVSGYSANVVANETRKGAVMVNDLESQMESMAQAAYSMGSETAYSRQELRQSNYAEFQLIRELRRYMTSNMLTRDYFLLFRNDSRVYSSFSSQGDKGAVYEYPLFAERILKTQDAEGLYQTLNGVSKNTVLFLSEEQAVFCFPMRIHSNSVNAVMGFLVPSAQLRARAQLVSGGLENCAVYYQGQLLFQIGEEKAGQAVEIPAETGGFSMTLWVDPSRYMSKLLSYRRITLFCLTIMLGILAVGVLTARRHVKPIRQLKRQLLPEAEGGALRANELNDISNRLSDLLAQDQERRRQFNSQRVFLRTQAIHLLLCGEYNERLRDMAARLGIAVENGRTGVLVIHSEEKLEESAVRNLAARIEDLSMEQMRFYCAADARSGDLNVILHVPALRQTGPAEAVELLRELLEAENIRAQIGDGWMYEDPRKLAASFAEARDKLLSREGEAWTEQSPQRCFDRIVGAVRLGETQEARRLFDQFAQENQEQLRSMMMQRYLFTELLNRLVRAAGESQVYLPPHQMSVVLTAPDCATACDGMREALEYLGQHMRPAENADEKLIYKVLEYVRAHYMENDLSLERLAEEFQVSAGYLSRLIRTSSGMKYKDYVLRLKMERAQECLRQGDSVTLTSQQCGYANISHFIKAFKLYVGVTPSVFQRSGEAPGPCVSPEEEETEE